LTDGLPRQEALRKIAMFSENPEEKELNLLKYFSKQDEFQKQILLLPMLNKKYRKRANFVLCGIY